MTSEQRPKQQEARDQTTWPSRLEGIQAGGTASAKPAGQQHTCQVEAAARWPGLGVRREEGGNTGWGCSRGHGGPSSAGQTLDLNLSESGHYGRVLSGFESALAVAVQRSPSGRGGGDMGRFGVGFAAGGPVRNPVGFSLCFKESLQEQTDVPHLPSLTALVSQFPTRAGCDSAKLGRQVFPASSHYGNHPASSHLGSCGSS